MRQQEILMWALKISEPRTVLGLLGSMMANSQRTPELFAVGRQGLEKGCYGEGAGNVAAPRGSRQTTFPDPCLVMSRLRVSREMAIHH
jgi:hypothetical protein